MDFTGHLAVGGLRCHPLTVMDAYRRDLVACVALRHPDGTQGWRVVEHLLDEFGRHELLGFDPIGSDAWPVRFGPLALGRIEGPAQERSRVRFRHLE